MNFYLQPYSVLLVCLVLLSEMNVVISFAFKRSVAFTRTCHVRMNYISNAAPLIKIMSVQDFGVILKGPTRTKYQIIDVREKDELLSMAIEGKDVLNLPLSDVANWSTKVLKGDLLDKNKPTLCLCKLGGRSMKAATFLGT